MITSVDPVIAVCCARDHQTLTTALALCGALRAQGIVSARVEYDGAYGQGHVGPVTFFDAARPPRVVAVSATALRQVTVLFQALLGCLSPRWVNEQGSVGHFSWDLAACRLFHEHQPRAVMRMNYVFPIPPVELVTLGPPLPP